MIWEVIELGRLGGGLSRVRVCQLECLTWGDSDLESGCVRGHMRAGELGFPSCRVSNCILVSEVPNSCNSTPGVNQKPTNSQILAAPPRQSTSGGAD